MQDSEFDLKPTIHDATLLHATFACNKVTYTVQQCCVQQSTYTVQQSCTQHFNIHDATKLHATMLFATLLHGKFNIHDATKLQATVACNFVASCMVGLTPSYTKFDQMHISQILSNTNMLNSILCSTPDLRRVQFFPSIKIKANYCYY